MSLSSPFIVKPIATSLLMVAIFFSGLLSYRFLPISSLPQVDYPTIQVTTTYPGASPKVMSTAVTATLERLFGQMPGLKQMTSSSSTGLSLILLQFNLDLSLDIAEQEVQAAINAASSYLPNQLPNSPIYSKINPADTPIITLSLTSKTITLPAIADLAETRLAQKISQISGVGLVTVSGGQRPAVRIQVNPNLLASYGMSSADIRNAIVSSNINGAKGSFNGNDISYTINANDQLISSSDYADLIITYKNGAPVRLKDIANVIDDVENNQQAAWVNNTQAIIINIQRQPGANVIKVADNIKALLPALSSSLPRDIELKILTDRTNSIRASVKDVEFELLLSIILVIIVMFCFLRNISATIIPSIVVPLSLIGTLGVMYLLDFSLNNLSLMALTIATGFVVDDAIVMIENITRYLEKEMNPLEAALKGASEIGFTIMSLTISLIAVLIPLFFMEDIIGRLFREFAITLAIAILLSAFISLTLTPMLCTKLLKHNTVKVDNKFIIYLEKYLATLTNQYKKSLKLVLEHQMITISVALITLCITGILFYIIPKGFFPSQDIGMIQAISQVRQNSSFANMSNMQQQLSKIILEDDAVESLSSFIGIDGINTTLNRGRILINLKDNKKRKVTASQVIERLQTKLSKMNSNYLYLQPVQDMSINVLVTPSEYQYSLSSHDTIEVIHYADLLFNQLKLHPQLKGVVIDQQNQGVQIHIDIDRDNASRLGVSMQNIVDTLYDIFGQRQISTIFTEYNQYHVILEGMSRPQQNIDSLGDVYVNSTTGNSIPLISLGKLSERTAPLIINKQNQFPVATISFNLANNISLGKAVDIIEKTKEKLKIPSHIKTSFQGTAQAFAGSASNKGWLMIAAVIVVYLVLGILYESYIHPLTILSTLPSACMGALIALILFNKDLDVISIIGIILLIGIVKKNAIMMIDFALAEQRTYGKAPIDAIFSACIVRFRPIIMTSMSALLAAIPLIIGNSVGSEIRSPLGITIMGGLVVSQILTLYTTPVIYLAFDRLEQRFYKNKRV